MKSYNLFQALVVTIFLLSGKALISINWTDQFIEIQAIPTINMNSGESGVAIIEVVTLDDYHIMADNGNQEHMQFTSIEIGEAIDGIEIGEPHFPVPEILPLDGSEYPISVFSGNIEFQVMVAIHPNIQPGIFKIPCIMTYQPCDKQKCYFPREVEFIIRLEVRG